MTPDTCPNCGAEIPARAKACPECGSDEQTGWSEQARTDLLNLPNQNFGYHEFVEREFGEPKKSPVPLGIHWFWWVIAILLLMGFVIAWLSHL